MLQLTYKSSHFALYYSPPISIFNDTMDLYKEVYEANTLLKFTVIVVDGGSPTRGATAAVEVDIDNSCLIDVEYQAIPYQLTVNSSTGEIYHRLPGYYYYEYSTKLFSLIAVVLINGNRLVLAYNEVTVFWSFSL